ncbi:MAG: DUF4097 family beta strand repeat-containing protein [Opitutaceae bacterium]|jgi:hypothetical protein
MNSSSPIHSPAAPAGGHASESLRLLALLCLALTGTAVFAENAAASVNFKDPAQPGRLKIYISRGDLHVRAGESPTEVSVKSDATPDKGQEPRKDGLRVLSDTSANFSLTVNDNVAELSYGKDSWPEGSSADFDVTVPRNTSLEIENGWGGDVIVEKLTGDVQIKGMNCEVKLVDLSGGTSVETMNGDIDASFALLPADKPVSFSSMNGEVSLRIPSDAKAKVRFRTHHGSILTDFPEGIIKTTSENLGGTDWAAYAGKHVAIAVNIAQEVSREVAHAAQEMAEEFKEAHHHANGETAVNAPSGKAAGEDTEKSEAKKPAVHMPRSPRPPNIPAISGGKVVSGTINGGGPEILVTTMNGDITLRHL